MDVIDKFSNFEDRLRCGYIEYAEGGSGVYVRQYNNEAGDIYHKDTSEVNVTEVTNIVDYIIRINDLNNYYENSYIGNFIIRDSYIKHIYGWVRGKIDEHYR
jgi:hypothetical protein